MSPRRRADQVSKIAYWAYLLLGLGLLIPAVLYLLFPPLGQLGLSYVFFIIFVGPILGTIGFILSLVRQLWGLEWKLLALLVSTAIYLFFLFMMETGLISPWWDAIVIVSFGAITTFLAIWHFVFDK